MSTADRFETSRRDRAQSLNAIHRLEKIASSPGWGRSDTWRADLGEALANLADQLRNQYTTSGDEGSALGSVIEEAPRLEPRVRTLRNRQRRLLDRVEDLGGYLADSDRPVDVAGLRSEIRDLVNEIQALRAEESDLVYEALYVDLGVGD